MSHEWQFHLEKRAHIRRRCQPQGHTDLTWMNSLKAFKIQPELSNYGRYSPSPSVTPATPTSGTRPPTTFTPVGLKCCIHLTPSRSSANLTVPDVISNFVLLKRAIEICTPIVEENLGFVVCPPPFIAKGIRLGPRILSYENVNEQNLTHRSRMAHNSTEQADTSELALKAW